MKTSARFRSLAPDRPVTAAPNHATEKKGSIMDHMDDAISCDDRDREQHDLSSRKERRGRPKADVFRKPGSGRSGVPLEMRRAICLARLNSWAEEYGDRIKSRRYRTEGKPDWELYRAAELAMAVMGRQAPEKVYKKPKHRRNLLAFDQEAKQFIRWLRNQIEITREGFKGPKPDFLKTWRTAVSLAVARYIVTKNGRHYSKPPTPREIAQIWFVLFGEHEPHGSIKTRLPTVARMCKHFSEDHVALLSQGECEYFRMAGDCVLRKLTPKSRCKGAQSRK